MASEASTNWSTLGEDDTFEGGKGDGVGMGGGVKGVDVGGGFTLSYLVTHAAQKYRGVEP